MTTRRDSDKALQEAARRWSKRLASYEALESDICRVIVNQSQAIRSQQVHNRDMPAIQPHELPDRYAINPQPVSTFILTMLVAGLFAIFVFAAYRAVHGHPW